MSVREIASVRVSEPVRGLPRARGADRGPRVAPVTRTTVAPALLEAARAAMRPGQRLVIVSATEVRLENVPTS